jgi:cytochrome c
MKLLLQVTLILLVLAVGAVVAIGYHREGDRIASQHVAVDATRGKTIIAAKNCGSCHVIPGVRNANGLVGPPLLWFARRTFIAGQLPNSPENLARWLKNPPSLAPKTAMPDLGLTDEEAHDVAAYLYTLK